MRKVVFFISVVFVFLFQIDAACAQSWTDVDTTGFSSGKAIYTSIAIDGSGTPYVAYVDGGDSNKVTVMKYNGTNWVIVGNEGFSAGGAAFTSIAIDRSGTPYVVYQDSANNLHATVMKYNGSSWVTVGSAGFTPVLCIYTSIAIDDSGTLYVAYEHGYVQGPTSVMKYTTTSGWVMVGTSDFSGIATKYNSIVIDNSGTPYVAFVYANRTSPAPAMVMKFNGSSWIAVDSVCPSTGTINFVSIAIDRSGVPYVAYNNEGLPGVTVKKFIDSNWVNVGATGFTGSIAQFITIAIDGSGTPYVAYQDFSSALKSTVMKFADSSWINVGCPGFSTGVVQYTSIAINASGNTYVVYEDSANGNRATVMTWGYTSASNSFSVSVNHICTGIQLSDYTVNADTGLTMQSSFGDGTSTTNTIIPSIIPSLCYFGGAAVVSHSYATSGTYSIKQVLHSDTIAIDSIQFSNNYTLCNSILLSFYYDANGNCIKDSGEIFNNAPLSVEVNLNGLAIDTISCISGFYYSAYGTPGDIYSFRILSVAGSMYISCPVSGTVYDTIISGGPYIYAKLIGLQCSSSPVFDLAINTIPEATGIHDQYGNIYLSNLSCLPTNGTVTMHYSQKYQYTPSLSVARPAPTTFTDSTITWNVSSLSSTNAEGVYIFYQIWNNPATGLTTIGDTVNTFVTVTPIVGDIDTINNVNIIVDTIKGGCDPNEMSVSPAGCLTLDSVTQLQYTINFMNTGNDTAFNISVLDTLPANANPNTLKMIMASATMNIGMYHTGGYNIVKFDFPHINLLDSAFNFPQSSGAVIFTINTIPGLTDGATVNNHAGIFFDDNPVVLTNTVQNTVGCPASLGVAVSKPTTTSIYPNPAHDALTITSSAKIEHVNISNLLGQTVYDHDYNTEQVQMSIGDLTAGVYFVKINGVEVRKFVKE